MSDSTGEQKIPEGSYAAGRRVALPAGAEQPILVFVNGQQQVEGDDYDVVGNEVVFTREIIKEQLSFARKAAMFFSVFGTYRKHETIDVQFQLAGKTELAGDLPVRK